MMQFRIEQFLLTDSEGDTVAPVEPLVSEREGDDVGATLREFVEERDAELLSEVRFYPGPQAVAAARNGRELYVLRVRE
jgi:hypothetical protein